MINRNHQTGKSKLFRVSVTVLASCLSAAVGAFSYAVLKKTNTSSLVVPAGEVVAEQDAPASSRASSSRSHSPAPLMGSLKPSLFDSVSPPVPSRPSAQEHAAEVMDNLKKSGPSRGAWGRNFERVFTTWKESSPVGSQVQFSDFECFRNGCAVTALYPDLRSFNVASDDLQDSQPFLTLNSGSFRSGPIEMPAGRIKAVWILYHTDN